MGSAATFAALPVVDSAGKPANNADWAILTADDGANQAGIYAYNGAVFSLAAEIPNSFVMAATVISPAATDATGLVGTSLDYARADHKHPAQDLYQHLILQLDHNLRKQHHKHRTHCLGHHRRYLLGLGF